MKKLNNKGFAISTVIYGLSIMGILLVAILMATMASTRSNSRQLAKSIEEELNRFSKTETFFNQKMSGTKPISQEYIVPANGWYKIELWGSSGANGAKGAYTTGIIELKEGQILYFYVGKNKSSKETDVRIVNGDYSDTYSASTRIMVAAGGGGTSTAAGGTLYGYNASMIATGGKIAAEKNKDFNLTSGTLIGLTSGYGPSTVKEPNPSNTIITPKVLGENGGGDGFTPSKDSNVGGASFIAGYAGSYGYEKYNNKLKISRNPIMNVYEQEYEDDSSDYIYTSSKGSYYFVDGMMLPNTNGSAGKAKIERMVVKTKDGEKLIKKNTNFNRNISSVKDCVDSTDANITTKISVISEGMELVPETATLSRSTENGQKCAIINFSSSKDIDEIAVWHKNSGVDYQNHNISVYDVEAHVWIPIKAKSAQTKFSETETVTGYRVSAYQYNSTGNLPDTGNYYIMPVLIDNKVVTAQANSTYDSKAIEIAEINGYKRQRWSIEKITPMKEEDPSGKYKVVELARYKALTILQDENIIGNELGADQIFNKYTRDDTQWWDIVPMGNGTYVIKTIIPPFEGSTGNAVAQTNSAYNTTYNKLIIGPSNAYNTTRFKLISVDYSSSN